MEYSGNNSWLLRGSLFYTHQSALRNEASVVNTVPNNVGPILALHLIERKKIGLSRGWRKLPEWLFFNEEGKHLNPDNLRDRVFHKALEKAGLRQMRIHDLRHTFASLLIMQGESLAYVRDQLGHASIQTTVDL